MRLALSIAALVQLDSACATSVLIGKRVNEVSADGRRMAGRALGVVHPLEEIPLEPLHQRFDHAILVTPGGFGFRTQ